MAMIMHRGLIDGFVLEALVRTKRRGGNAGLIC